MKHIIFIVLKKIHKTIMFTGRKLKQLYFGIGTTIKNKYFKDLNSTDTLFSPNLPEWVVDEMKNLSKSIDDPSIYPTDDLLSKYTEYAIPIRPKPGKIYHQILQDIKYNEYNYCFMFPWLKRGGADYVSLLHVEYANSQPNSKVLVILTESSDSPWISKLPKDIDVINLKDIFKEISYEETILVITRLLVQLKINTLHIINSRLGWDIVKKHGLALKTVGINIFASLFADGHDKYARPVGYAREYLPYCYKYLDLVFSDNETFTKLLCKTYGYPESLFKILRVPPPLNMTYKERQTLSPPKILWAGRLDREKRPDLLLEIAKKMPDVEFDVYGSPTLTHEKETIKGLKKQKNVTLLGSFSGAETLPFNIHTAFLYTSQYDGMPNILIAAAYASIPIVASCVGGIGELITEQTGYPIKNIENISDYVNAIKAILDNPEEAKNRAKKAREYILNNHNRELFFKNLKEIENYFGNTKKTMNNSRSRQIEINYTVKHNELAYLCDKYGTDKGSLHEGEHPYPWPPHTYTDIYYLLFNQNRKNIKRILECGIGTNNPNLPSSMGITGKPGASLKVWRDFFPNAIIYGCDIDKTILFNEDRIKTFYCDQTNKESIKLMIKEIGESNFDIIIDDGLHEFKAGITFFETMINYLADNGIYIIEDINDLNMSKYAEYFENKDFMVYQIKLYREPNPINDNQIIIITKLIS